MRVLRFRGKSSNAEVRQVLLTQRAKDISLGTPTLHQGESGFSQPHLRPA